MLFGWWAVEPLSTPPRVQVNWLYRYSYAVPIPFLALSAFPNSSIRTQQLRSVFVCGSLHLSESGEGWGLSEDRHDRHQYPSIKALLIVSGIDAYPWAGLSLPSQFRHSSVSAPSFPLHFFQTGPIVDQKFRRWVGVPIPPLGVLSG